MIKKLKTLIFSTTFLTYSAFSAHAMTDDYLAEVDALFASINLVPMVAPVVHDPEYKKRVDAFIKHYNLPYWLTDDVYHAVKGYPFELNEYGAPNLDYMVARLYYVKHRDPAEFGLLFDLFAKTPFENRPKIWETLVAFQVYQSFGPPLCEFYYDSMGELKASIRKIEGTVSLKDKLFSLPQK